jgi:putative heme-binding domain-containing protein
MGVTLRYGPDGGVFASDWSDTGECHSTQNTRRETGRIYKITYGTPKPVSVDLAKLSDLELVELQQHRNDWYVQHARRLLQERAAAGRDLTAAAQRLQAMYGNETDIPRKLRALWALAVIGHAPAEFLQSQLHHESESIRAWAVRLLCEDQHPSAAALATFADMAAHDSSPYVRLYLASCLQRLPIAQRWPIAEALLKHGEDADDHNLPLMNWYAVEPLVEADLPRFVKLAGITQIPLVARHIGRRVCDRSDPRPGLDLVTAEVASLDPRIAGELLGGVIQGLEGRRQVAMPQGWATAYAKLQSSEDEAVRERSLQLALIFDDPTALRDLRQVATDPKAEATRRNRAITALAAKRQPDCARMLIPLVSDPATRRAAIRALAEFDHPETATVLLKDYATFDAPARQDALQTLAARPAWATLLLDAVEAGKVPRTDITAYTARQLMSLRDPKLGERIRKTWGELRTTPAEKAKLIASYQRKLPLDAIRRADASAGRVLFQKTCANCHRFFGEGGSIGPDITGSQRTSLDYLLQTLIDPSAAVARDYQMQIIQTTAGRVITGLVVGETKAAVTVQTVNEKVVIPVDEIEERAVSQVSMMPEGMLQTLTDPQAANLLAYLMSSAQVDLPKEAGTAGK